MGGGGMGGGRGGGRGGGMGGGMGAAMMNAPSPDLLNRIDALPPPTNSPASPPPRSTIRPSLPGLLSNARLLILSVIACCW